MTPATEAFFPEIFQIQKKMIIGMDLVPTWGEVVDPLEDRQPNWTQIWASIHQGHCHTLPPRIYRHN